MNSHPLNRKERDRQLRREDIIKAAEQVFAAQGYQKATIKDIAQKAQYATGTVYLYFKDKNELYHTLLQNKTVLLLSNVNEKIQGVSEAGKKLEIFVKEAFRFFEQNHDFSRIFLLESDNSIEEKRFFSSPHGKRFRDFIVSLVRSAQDEGVLRGDIDAQQLERIFHEVLKAIIVHWLEYPQAYDNDSSVAAVRALDLFLHGTIRR